MNWAARVAAVIRKDLRSEYRARYAVNSVMLFCVTCLAVVSFSLGGAATDPRVKASLLWVILFFSAMTGLSRAFIKEEDRGTMNLLKLTCDPQQAFYGKVAVNFLLMGVVLLIVSPLFMIMMNVERVHAGYFAALALFSTLGLSAVSTLLSAMVAGARARETLFPVLAFPVLMPVFMVAVKATEKALVAPAPWPNDRLLLFLACYSIAALVGGGMLFEYVFSD